MSVNLEWSTGMSIVSEYATVPINSLLPAGGDAYLYEIEDPTTYKIVPAKFRPVVDSLSQADGSSIQPPYIDGLVASLEVAFWFCPNALREAHEPACEADLRLMDQLLMGALNSLREVPLEETDQQYRWRPTGAAHDRLLNGAILASWPTPNFADSPLVRLAFELGSPFPYAVDDVVTTTVIASGGSAVVPNGGNCDYFPTIRVHGPSSGFALVNNATGRLISYDSTRPGASAIAGGHYAEIDCFAGSILLDGNPTNDLVAGLDPASTDLFPIEPGGDDVSVSGATTDFLTQPCWV